jgi:hypothetical protein
MTNTGKPALLLAYAGLVLMSIMVLTVIPKEFERMPWLVNKKWKRVLWLLSCFILLPPAVVILRLPFFVVQEINKFIRGNNQN